METRRILVSADHRISSFFSRAHPGQGAPVVLFERFVGALGLVLVGWTRWRAADGGERRRIVVAMMRFLLEQKLRDGERPALVGPGAEQVIGARNRPSAVASAEPERWTSFEARWRHAGSARPTRRGAWSADSARARGEIGVHLAQQVGTIPFALFDQRRNLRCSGSRCGLLAARELDGGPHRLRGRLVVVFI